MLSKLIESLKYYPEEYFQQAFYNEMKCIFQNRLTTEQHKSKFDNILEQTCRRLFDVDDAMYFFVPSGSQSTVLQYTTQNDWMEIVKRNIAVCSKH